VSAWTLIGRDLCLEYNDRAAAILGFPHVHSLRLDVPQHDVGRVRDALLEIPQSTGCVVNTPEGRFVQ
jgi:hypothetical protein